MVRLKTSFVFAFYESNIKNIPLARGMIIWMWRSLYLPLASFTNLMASRESRRWRQIIKLADYIKVMDSPTTRVFDLVRVDTPQPNVFPIEDRLYIRPPLDHYTFPPVYVAQVNDALVYGGSNLVFSRDVVICHDLYDLKKDYTSEELHGRHLIDAAKMRMRVLRVDSVPEHIDAAAVFVDACAANYAHWMTEVLPRIAAFCSVDEFESIPIIVNDDLHTNILASLALIVGHERQILLLPIGRGIHINELYITSVSGYVPFDRRDESRTGHSHGAFNPLTLDLVRRKILWQTRKISSKDYPKKIYLRRNSGARRLRNSSDVEIYLGLQGYTSIEAEKLSFLQQVVLFSNANEVFSPTGAALVNVIFCCPGARITICMSKHRKMIYRYWLNMFSPYKLNMNYILGKIDENNNNGIHGDFKIDMDDVKASFKLEGC